MSGQSRAGLLATVVLLSLFLATILNVYPLSHAVSFLRPEFLCLIVIYWIVSIPHHIGVVFAWSTGLFQDIVEGTVWGAHALALTLLAYICLLSWQRIRSYSIWQQSMWVFILVGMHQVVVSWIQGLAGYQNPIHLLLLPTIVSACVWPILFLSLQSVRLRYRLL